MTLPYGVKPIALIPLYHAAYADRMHMLAGSLATKANIHVAGWTPVHSIYNDT